MLPLAVQIGAGNIGRGFLGQLFFESGLQIRFIDADQALVQRLNDAGEYRIELVDSESRQSLRIANLSACTPSSRETVMGAFAQASVAATAVGAAVLPRVGEMLAWALLQRLESPSAEPLNIFVCENLPHAAARLRDTVREHLPAELRAHLDECVGFVDTVIGRMVPVVSESERAADPLCVRVEPYCTLPYDADAVIGTLPALTHFKPMHNFQACVDEKLFVHNASHATAAYIGHLYRHTYIHEAIADSRVYAVVSGAMDEVCEALCRKHGTPLSELKVRARDLARRYANPALRDTIARVARDPARKLAPNDRLIGAARCCLQNDVRPKNLAFAAAAAIRYDPGSDAPDSCIAGGGGIDAVLTTICGISPGDPLAGMIRFADAAITRGLLPGT